jgi:hypothetical protein
MISIPYAIISIRCVLVVTTVVVIVAVGVVRTIDDTSISYSHSISDLD